MPWEPVATAFGITGAVLLVGGGIVLRYQRDKAHFRLMEKALEKGITSYQGMAPSWLISMRIGMLCLVLGVGLIGSGVGARVWAETDAGVGQVESEPPPPLAVPDPTSEVGRPPPAGPVGGGPAMERWHRMQVEQTLGLCAVCAGAILAMLGVVRMAFAGMEKKYLVASDPGAKV